MQFRLGFGPLSHRIIDSLVSYSNEKKRPIMIIASRNQIDKDSGYVMTTTDLNKKVKKTKFIKICRDHCGPYFLDNEKELSLPEALNATKMTIEADIENGFDLIHIDTSRCITPLIVAEDLFNFSLKLKSNLEFEFGTEENVGVKTSVKKYKESVDFAKNFPNVKFVVAQTGSLVMENKQFGKTTSAILKKLVDVANKNQVYLKEHNADYLTKDQISLRRITGVHALNIAPQLGVMETMTVLNLANQYGVDTQNFKNLVLKNNKWKKWMLDDDNNVKIIVAGHYHFNSYEYSKLNDRLQKFVDIDKTVTENLYNIFDCYFENFYEKSSICI